MNKKAVSPIVVTVLLITFVIALGVVINAWMRATVQTYVDEGEKDIQAGIGCLNVKMQLEKDTNKIYIKNNGEVELSGYSAVLYQGEISNVFNHQNINITKYNAVEYPPVGGETITVLNNKVKIIPFITTQEGITSECTDQAITLTL